MYTIYVAIKNIYIPGEEGLNNFLTFFWFFFYYLIFSQLFFGLNKISFQNEYVLVYAQYILEI